jgi:DNA mismatch endonuclease (patch repair protein)
MVDTVDTATRSKMMSGIRGRNTRPEVELRSALHALGYRFRLHVKDLPGRPDIVLPRYRAVVQVNGCFWHRHDGCRLATTPATRPEFWDRKFAQNVARDRHNAIAIIESGWRLAVVWECAMKSRGKHAVAEELSKWFRSGQMSIEIERDAECCVKQRTSASRPTKVSLVEPRQGNKHYGKWLTPTRPSVLRF